MEKFISVAAVPIEGKFAEINESLLTYCILIVLAFVLTIAFIRYTFFNKNNK